MELYHVIIYLFLETGLGFILHRQTSVAHTLCLRDTYKLTLKHEHIHLPCPPAAFAVQNREIQQNKYSYYYTSFIIFTKNRHYFDHPV